MQGVQSGPVRPFCETNVPVRVHIVYHGVPVQKLGVLVQKHGIIEHKHGGLAWQCQ